MNWLPDTTIYSIMVLLTCVCLIDWMLIKQSFCVCASHFFTLSFEHLDAQSTAQSQFSRSSNIWPPHPASGETNKLCSDGAMASVAFFSPMKRPRIVTLDTKAWSPGRRRLFCLEFLKMALSHRHNVSIAHRSQTTSSVNYVAGPRPPGDSPRAMGTAAAQKRHGHL